MRWVSKLLALAVAGVLGTNALDATIFTFPSEEAYQNRPHQLQTISEDFARLILELRTKSSLASVLGRTETETVDYLNQFADTDLTLFGGSDGHVAPGRNLLVLEGVDEEAGTRTSPENTDGELTSYLHPAGSAVRKIQPNHMIIPHLSSTLLEVDALEPFVAGVNEERCSYNSDAGVTQSSSAQVDPPCCPLGICRHFG